MPVFSKMTAKRTQGKTVVTGALCAGALVAASAPGFLPPQHATLRTVATTRADSTAKALPVAGQGAQSTPASITAGATLGLAAAVLTSASTKSRAARPMPVFSKMTAKRTRGKTVVTGALCAGALLASSAPGFLAPQLAALRAVASTRADSTARALPVSGQGAQSTPPSIAASATLGLAAAVLTSASTKSHAARRSGVSRPATSGDEQSQSSKPADYGSLGQLVA
eukprot:CAMPEP_0183489236 /NCGR_PEP_ID=MMETSP0370-20130417/181343_1 /TAXON_ID=268820 /ORGANISM="Peridinium aciculiferum, Strain PAER-2" /LENGTH=224 /DNA_ID=CAMNT_0025682569 /DNA_START=53 /DNA_END=723 /DNA_ORIENTATION=-